MPYKFQQPLSSKYKLKTQELIDIFLIFCITIIEIGNLSKKAVISTISENEKSGVRCKSSNSFITIIPMKRRQLSYSISPSYCRYASSIEMQLRQSQNTMQVISIGYFLTEVLRSTLENYR